MDASQVNNELPAAGAASAAISLSKLPEGNLLKVAPAIQRVKGLVKSTSLRGRRPFRSPIGIRAASDSTDRSGIANRSLSADWSVFNPATLVNANAKVPLSVTASATITTRTPEIASLEAIVALLERQGALETANSFKGVSSVDNAEHHGAADAAAKAGSNKTHPQSSTTDPNNSGHADVGIPTLARHYSFGSAETATGNLLDDGSSAEQSLHPRVYPSYEKLGVELKDRNRARTLSLDNDSNGSHGSIIPSSHSSIIELDPKTALHNTVMGIFAEAEQRYPRLAAIFTLAKTKFTNGLNDNEAVLLEYSARKVAMEYLAVAFSDKVREYDLEFGNASHARIVAEEEVDRMKLHVTELDQAHAGITWDLARLEAQVKREVDLNMGLRASLTSANAQLLAANARITANDEDRESYDFYRNYYLAQQNLYNAHFRQHDADYDERVFSGIIVPVLDPPIPAREEHDEDAEVVDATAVRIAAIGTDGEFTTSGEGFSADGASSIHDN